MRMLVDFINQSVRVMRVAKKPMYGEFERMLRIVSVAALGIGLIGYIISVLFSLI